MLIQGVAQILALFVLRARRRRRAVSNAALSASRARCAGGLDAGLRIYRRRGDRARAGWLAAGAVTFLVFARKERWWPFVRGALADVLRRDARRRARLRLERLATTSRIVYGARLSGLHGGGKTVLRLRRGLLLRAHPARRSGAMTLIAYKQLGINTIDLYCIWNWHEPAEGVRDFTGSTDPSRDLLGVLRLTHELGFKVILRPGPVIRNEWRNGGYPAWLFERPRTTCRCTTFSRGVIPRPPRCKTRMPTPPRPSGYRTRCISPPPGGGCTTCCEPSNRIRTTSSRLRSTTIKARTSTTTPGRHRSGTPTLAWLRSTVQSVTGRRVPLFINTYEMRVPSASPAWAWGNWYQSDAYTIGAHDLADLDFATGLAADAAQSSGDAVGVSGRLAAGRRRRRAATQRSIQYRARTCGAVARRRARRRELPGAGYDLSTRLGGAVGELVLCLGCGAHRRPARGSALCCRRGHSAISLRATGGC